MKKVLADNCALQVLQFGWWRYPLEVLQHRPDDEKASTQKTKSKEHIEVDGIDFLKQASANVTFLSLRGISGVEELPQDIGKQQNLMILDLRACHNLEKLPEKPRSILREFLKPILPKVLRSKLRDAMWFKNLNHLDMLECYLLDHMPKWMCELSNLEVLKGFVAGDATGSKDQFCQIGDLSKLKKLRKLSIKVAKLPEEPIDLKHLEKLSVLTITWKLDDHQNTGKISFPENLVKLDMRCYPYAEAPELFNRPPAEQEKLKRLYIRGRKLTKLNNPNPNPNPDFDGAEMLRLRSLNYLHLCFTDLRKVYPTLKCVEYDKCPLLENFPKDKTCHIFASAHVPEATDDEQKQSPGQRPGKEIMTEQPKPNKLLADSNIKD